MSPTDWMDRNFFRRIEVCFPVLDRSLKRRVILEGLQSYLKDNKDAREMDSDGSYRRRRHRGRAYFAQSKLLAALA
ncbi:hypothetical protein ACFQAT_10040 [Undibacterium arcticum]|uniref:Polyphosphate kinase C-terminal domain-containing protein n=1 Tax=Undibacterium arcticum TaxID=1762892 RepID=A0ABV7F1L1_9BURK